eukprot:TRINITY_DN5883_c0_g1_i2.p1 TRINITY_DN5883_c0_g1~~TRINITY_DN5883_c0_g1_i2.p1  ORF type:complete len:391 (-),score=60.47 TRINITY_DN5883_c0_g1_i2:151-1323(-)
MAPIPAFSHLQGCRLVLEIYDCTVFPETLIYTTLVPNTEPRHYVSMYTGSDSIVLNLPAGLVVQGDILIRAYHLATRFGYTTTNIPMFRVSFHTAFVHSSVFFSKGQLDLAYKDKRFSDQFTLQLIVEETKEMPCVVQDPDLWTPHMHQDFLAVAKKNMAAADKRRELTSLGPQEDLWVSQEEWEMLQASSAPLAHSPYSTSPTPGLSFDWRRGKSNKKKAHALLAVEDDEEAEDTEDFSDGEGTEQERARFSKELAKSQMKGGAHTTTTTRTTTATGEKASEEDQEVLKQGQPTTASGDDIDLSRLADDLSALEQQVGELPSFLDLSSHVRIDHTHNHLHSPDDNVRERSSSVGIDDFILLPSTSATTTRSPHASPSSTKELKPLPKTD